MATGGRRAMVAGLLRIHHHHRSLDYREEEGAANEGLELRLME